MMTLSFSCPGCGKAFVKANRLGGFRAVCRSCHNEFSIPSPLQSGNPFPPTTLNFTCPHCEEVYRKENQLAGQRARCRDCGAVFVVPVLENDDVPYVPPVAPQPAPRAVSPAPQPQPQPKSHAANGANGASSPPPPILDVQIDDDDEEPIVFEEIEEDGLEFEKDDDVYNVPARNNDLPEPVLVPVKLDDPGPLRPAKKKKEKDKAPRNEADAPGALARAIGLFDAFLEAPWIIRRGIIVLAALLIVFLFMEPGASFRGWVGSFFSGPGLEADDTPDPELDETPVIAVRPDLLSAHEQALNNLTKALNALTAVLEPIQDLGGFSAAAPRLEAAANQIEAAGNAGGKLARVNRAEATRIRQTVLPRLETAVGKLNVVLQRGMQNPALKPAYEPMKQGFAPIVPEMQKDYPDATDTVVELKIPGVASEKIGQYIRNRFDLEIPQPYRRRVGMNTDGNKKIERIRFGPVEDPEDVVRRIKFAKVVRVYKRRIYLAAPNPSEAELAAAQTAWDTQKQASEGSNAPARSSGPAPPAKAQQPPRAPAGSNPTPAPAPATAARPPLPGPSAGQTSGQWFVVFRGRDPKLWDTDTPSGPTTATRLANVPQDIQYIRLTRLDTGEALIVPVTAPMLGRAPEVDRKKPSAPHWSGVNHEAWGARHMGIAGGPIIIGSTPEAHGALIVQDDFVDGFTGSGFAHLGYGESKQYYAWRGKEIPPTDFEIAVSAGPLSDAEKTQVVVKPDTP